MNAAIITTGLSKNFGDIKAVDHLDLSVKQGEMFGMVGPDGAGKTTTIRMLCAILAPTSGSATILGHDIRKEPHLVKQDIGYLSQRFTLYGDLSIDENMEFFAEINKVYDYRERREELLEFTRLTPFRDRLAEKLSGGMKQKLALACTLIHRPKILFLDEPTTGVDPVSRRDFWRILQNLLAGGITIVMSTPYLDEAERCTRVALMNDGGAMVVDTPANLKKLMHGEIFEIVCNRVRDAFALLKANPMVREVQAFGDRLNVLIEDGSRQLSAVTTLLQSSGVLIETARAVTPSLENVFISLLTRKESR
ncbi:MAG TPA: ABC transporter ATP-binding protein [Bacteroidota bacterium]|jgi:ABC-2 type transport system ATP-binding protein|nr:ABC transporter ATP-binding protein [Bacteroidota bacterium]